MFTALALKFISFYQKYLSLDTGPFRRVGGFCKYTPSCSEYAKQSILKYGFLKGFFKAGCRVLRCNPCSKGGIDLP